MTRRPAAARPPAQTECRVVSRDVEGLLPLPGVARCKIFFIRRWRPPGSDGCLVPDWGVAAVLALVHLSRVWRHCVACFWSC